MVKAEAVGGSPTEEASVDEEEKRRLEEERKRVAQQKKHAEAILERCAKCRRTGGFAVLDEWLFGIYLSSQVAHKYHTIREVVHKFHTSSVDSLHHPSLLSGGSGTWSMRWWRSRRRSRSTSFQSEECMERLEYEKDGKSAITWDYFGFTFGLTWDGFACTWDGFRFTSDGFRITWRWL